MNGDSLLYWMTDRGAGSWQQFKDAASVLGSDRPGLASYILASANYADFAFTARARWRIAPPALFCIGGQQHGAVLVGARTPRMLKELQRSCQQQRVQTTFEPAQDAPQRIVLHGERSAFERLAGDARFTFISDPLAHFAEAVQPIWALLRERGPEARPMNWTARYFDFDSFSWVEGVKTGAACEFTSSYQTKRYFLQAARNRFIPMNRHECVYASAAISGLRLASYSDLERALFVPAKAALPVSFARWATVMSSDQPTLNSGLIRYTLTDATAAQTLLAYLGQPYGCDVKASS